MYDYKPHIPTSSSTQLSLLEILIPCAIAHKTMKFLHEKLCYSSFLVIFFYVVLALASLQVNNVSSALSLPYRGKFPALIVFGDSIVDPGNNNRLVTISKCNFQPYGRDFMGGIPTGRFCNGKVPSDILAEGLGIKELLPAYLDPNLQVQDLATGVSFASGGAGYDPLTAKLATVLSLSDQLDMFRDYLTKLNSTFGEERRANIVSQSIYVVIVGSDDIANTYFAVPFRNREYDINSYTDLMISSASCFYQELYGLGARRIGVLSLPPIGCVPSQRTLRGGIQRECSEAQNQAAILFNSKLSSTIDFLNQKLKDSRLVYLDAFNTLLSMIQDPARYGFQVATKGCCGTGNLEVSILCNKFTDQKSCTDASKYVFWDSFHPTEKAYQVLISLVVTPETIEKFL